MRSPTPAVATTDLPYVAPIGRAWRAVEATTAAGLWFATSEACSAILMSLPTICVGFWLTTDEGSDPFHVLLRAHRRPSGDDAWSPTRLSWHASTPRAKQATPISVPRDTKVEYKGETMKINACCSLAAPRPWSRRSTAVRCSDFHYAEVSFDGAGAD